MPCVYNQLNLTVKADLEYIYFMVSNERQTFIISNSIEFSAVFS